LAYAAARTALNSVVAGGPVPVQGLGGVGGAHRGFECGCV